MARKGGRSAGPRMEMCSAAAEFEGSLGRNIVDENLLFGDELLDAGTADFFKARDEELIEALAGGVSCDGDRDWKLFSHTIWLDNVRRAGIGLSLRKDIAKTKLAGEIRMESAGSRSGLRRNCLRAWAQPPDQAAGEHEADRDQLRAAHRPAED